MGVLAGAPYLKYEKSPQRPLVQYSLGLMLLSFDAINLFGGILWQRSGICAKKRKKQISPEWISKD